MNLLSMHLKWVSYLLKTADMGKVANRCVVLLVINLYTVCVQSN